jgi:outer membrane protein assembly factor BamB
LVSVSAFTLMVSAAWADWRQFRGNLVNGLAEKPAAPKSLADIAWKSELPGRGLSGPIVVGEHVIVTSSSGIDQNRLHVQSFDARSGEEEWHRQFWATGRTMCHDKMCVATPTPASDGERIFAFYSSNDVICLDLQGNLLWYRGLTYDYPNASNSLGMASSPVVVDDTLIVQVESDAEAFAVGLDTTNGLERWKIERPRRANWTSPVVLEPSDDLPGAVLLQSSRGVQAVDPKTGKQLWKYTEGASTIPSSVAMGQVVYVPSHGITALRPNPESESPEMLWRAGHLAPGTASPFLFEGRLFVLNSSGALTSADTKDGKRQWQLRLKGPFSGSPVGAGGKIYFFSEDGLAQAVLPGEKKGEIVEEYDLKETILCTPAISDGAIFVRSDRHLYKIASE